MNILKRVPFAQAIIVSFFIILFSVVAYKAIFIPVTHDEKLASVHYPRLAVWQILMSDELPTNHILNSLFIKVSENVFGIEPWSIRLPNILFFVFFFGVLYFIAKRWFTQSAVVFCLPFFIMFGNPFLLDFFSLARGYGMSNALMSCSVFFLLMFSSTYKQRWYYLTILFAMLAAYANFTLLIYWVAVQLLLVGLYFYHAYRSKQPVKRIVTQLLYTAAIAFAFMGLCFMPLYKMNSTNQFVYWSKEGFYKVTFLNQVENFLYAVKYSILPVARVAGFILAILFVVGVYSINKIVRNVQTAVANPLVILFLLLLLVWLINVTQSALLGTPFLTDRTALSYYVLFAFVFMFALRAISGHVRWFAYAGAPLIIILFTLHLCFSVDLTYVREWKYDSDTYKVMDYLRNYQKEHPEVKTIDLNTSWWYNRSFGFYSITGKTPWINLTEFHQDVDTVSNTLFYYARQEDSLELSRYYTVALDFPDNEGVLMLRK